MKPVLTLAALLISLATPALAEEATTTTPPQQPEVQAAVQPATPLILPAALPRSKAPQAPAMSVAPAEALGPAGGGCHHGGEQVYLTN